jgi:hypothetical protein
MTKTAAVISVLSANILLAMVGRGSMYQLIFIIMVIEFIAFPVFLVGLISYMLRRKLKSGHALARRFTFFGLMLASTIVSLVPGRMIRNYDINAAKAYCEKLVPKLEAFRLAHGAYPSSIDEISNHENLPRLVENSVFYRSDGLEYSFSFGDPYGMLNGFAFDSRTQSWSKWD